MTFRMMNNTSGAADTVETDVRSRTHAHTHTHTHTHTHRYTVRRGKHMGSEERVTKWRAIKCQAAMTRDRLCPQMGSDG